VILSSLHKPSTDRVAFHIQHAAKGVELIHWSREIPTMPEMTHPPVLLVEGLSMDPVGFTNDLSEAISVLRNQNKMHVIGHQTPGQNLDTMPARSMSQQANVELSVLIIPEDSLAIVPSLCDVMSSALYDNACVT
jgi:hypothetical protein